jgi:hypothetical protein
MDGALPMIRRLLILAALAAALVACERLVDLTPPPDAHGPDSHLLDAVVDTPPPDAPSSLDGAAIGDAFVPPD